MLRRTGATAKRSVYALACAAALAAFGCAGGDNSGSSDEPGSDTTTTTAAPNSGRGDGVVVVGTTGTPGSLDPVQDDGTGAEVIRNFSEPLLRYKAGTLELEPGVAEAMPVASQGGRAWTFTLRDGLKFGDGTPVTAEEYAEAMTKRALGLKGVGANSTVIPYVKSVSAAGREVTFELTEPIAFFPELTASNAYSPTHPKLFPMNKLVKSPKAPVYGVGQWTITRYRPSEEITLEPNPHYYGGAPAASQVIVRIFADSQALALALRSGEIDVAYNELDLDQLDELDSKGGAKVGTAIVSQGGLLAINQKSAPTSNRDVRKAIALAVDRDELIDRVFGGRLKPLLGQIRPGLPGASESYAERYPGPDVETAREHLTTAGYSESKPVKLTLGFSLEFSGPSPQEAMQVVKEQLEATGMMEVELDGIADSPFFEKATGGKYDMSWYGYTGFYFDPASEFGLFFEAGGLGTFATDADDKPLSDTATELQTALKDAAVTLDPAEREAKYAKIEATWTDEVITVPIWYKQRYVAYRDCISGDAELANPEGLNLTRYLNYGLLKDGCA